MNHILKLRGLKRNGLPMTLRAIFSIKININLNHVEGQTSFDQWCLGNYHSNSSEHIDNSNNGD